MTTDGGSSATTGVAVVGLGWWGRHIAELVSGAVPGLALTATVDPDTASGADLAALDAALDRDDVDAVILCTPNSTHSEQVLRCAAAGKHVWCEKPLALKPDDARSMVAACREASVVLWVGHERRFEPGWSALRDAVVRGELGTILHAEAAFSHDKFRALSADHWRGSTGEAPAAGMTGMGIHLTDWLIWALGRVETVTALVERRVLPLPTGDVVAAQLGFASGAVAHLSSLSVTPFYGRLAVFGSEGWTEVRDHGHPEEGRAADVVHCSRDGTPETTVTDATDSVAASLRAFAAAIGDDDDDDDAADATAATVRFTDFELTHNIEVLDAIVLSADTGATIHLPAP